MKILAMDTSSKVTSVALLDEDKILGEINLNTSIMHSKTLMPMCKNLLEICNITTTAVDVFAVANGPGSFTGLRIGISAIKGMAFSQNKPCVEVSALEALAYNLSDYDGVVCAITDARREQGYNALFSKKNDIITRLCDDRFIEFNELSEELKNIKENIIFVGDGADLCYNVIGTDNIKLASSCDIHQKASSVGLIARKKIVNNETVLPRELMPKYLQLPQAQRELLKRKENKS